MLGWRAISAAVLVVMTVFPAVNESLGRALATESKPADAQSNKEFHDQIEAIIQSYRKHDTVKGRQLIEKLRLPNAQK